MAETSIPKPKTLRERIHLSLMLAAIVAIGFVLAAAQMHLVDAQFIGSSELKQSVQQLQSYTSEAKLLTHYSQRRVPTRAYVQAYGSALQKAVDSTAQKLDEHAHDRKLDEQTARTVTVAQHLSALLNALITEPTNQLPSAADMDSQYHGITQQLNHLEDKL